MLCYRQRNQRSCHGDQNLQDNCSRSGGIPRTHELGILGSYHHPPHTHYLDDGQSAR